VAKGQAEKAEKLGLGQEWVLRRLVQVVERCLQAEAVVDRMGEPVIIETPEGEMGAAYTFQAAGANRALELLGKHLNLFNETVIEHEHTHDHNVHIIPASEIRDEIEELFLGPSFSRAH
jgi:phage terminase small subunit